MNFPRITQALKHTFFSYLITDLAPFLYIRDLDLNFIYKYTKCIVKGHFHISVGIKTCFIVCLLDKFLCL